MSADLLTALRLETRNAHQALEAEIDFLNASLNVERYVQTLRVFEAFVREWETLATRSCPEELAIFFRSRRRAHLLEADLAFFNAISIDAKPSLPSLDIPSSFWGAFYVMEGSTLGGQVIARRLESALRLSGGNGYRYFLGDGANTGRRWKEFTTLLTQTSPSLVQDEVIAAANAAFEAFRSFYMRHAKAHSFSKIQAPLAR